MKLTQTPNTGHSSKNKNLLILGIVFACLILTWFLINFAPNKIESLQVHASNLLNLLYKNPIAGTSIFVGLYFLMNALPMPLISLPTILAGYLFGTVFGLLIVSFVSALGASCLFLMSRYLLKNWIKESIIPRFPTLNRIEQSDNFLHALCLRFLPGIPICIPSIVLSLTNISLQRFYASTQLGMLLILFVYVNAGSELAKLNSIKDVFSTGLIISMSLLALSPFLTNIVMRQLQPLKD